jgi:hypothetical protein
LRKIAAQLAIGHATSSSMTACTTQLAPEHELQDRTGLGSLF